MGERAGERAGERTVVVGGGVMGVAIALHLARRLRGTDHEVVLLERRELAAGSSGRSGAILRQHYSERAVAAMARDSLREYASFHARTGRWIGFQRCGVLTIAGAHDPDALARIERNIAMQRSIGIDTRRVEAPEIRRLAPGASVADGSVAAYEPGGGFVDPVRTVEALATLARSQGAITRVGVAAEGLELDGGRVRGVRTSAGTLAAQRVVVAAGPWTRRLLQPSGIDLPLTVLAPEQHFVAAPQAAEPPDEGGERRALPPDDGIDARFAPDAEREPAAPHPVLLDLEFDFYARCEPGRARTRVGKLDYSGHRTLEDPDALDERVRPDFARWARGALVSRMPSYARRPDAGELTGWYTMTPDAQALIGPLPQVEGLFVVSGFSGHGFKLAPSVGEGVAQMLAGELVSAFDAEFFSPQRFTADVAPFGGSPSGSAFGL